MSSDTQNTVYLGIDVHKKTYAIAAVRDGQVVKRDVLTASPEGLLNYCQKFFPELTIISGYEAGYFGFALHRHLVANGIQNRVIHAAAIETVAKDRVKNDKRDSLKIATQLSAGRLEGIHVPSPEREQYRAISRLRECFLRERQRIGNQLKAFLSQHGVSFEADKVVSKRWVEDLMAISISPAVDIGIQMYGRAWKECADKMAELEVVLAEQAQEDKDLERLYRSVPGIGPTVARVLANELGDMSQFSNEGKLFSYLGLTPSQHSSGDRVRYGSISRQGRPILRRHLVQSAWVAIKKDPVLKEAFERISKNAGKKRAIVAIARKLSGRIRSCLRSGREYQVLAN